MRNFEKLLACVPGWDVLGNLLDLSAVGEVVSSVEEFRQNHQVSPTPLEETQGPINVLLDKEKFRVHLHETNTHCDHLESVSTCNSRIDLLVGGHLQSKFPLQETASHTSIILRVQAHNSGRLDWYTCTSAERGKLGAAFHERGASHGIVQKDAAFKEKGGRLERPQQCGRPASSPKMNEYL